MVKGRVDSIESFGLVDGPGIRTVVFLSGCKLRCKYCHNPEMWKMEEENYTPKQLVEKIIRFKPYFKKNRGGVTFSGGEPLLQADFLIEVCKLLKEEKIHIALDTAGVGVGKYEEVLENVDLVILDIKHITEEGYKDLTGGDMAESLKFLEVAQKMKKKLWLRQVIVPGIMDNKEYIDQLYEFIKDIKYVEKIEFLPYHKLGSEKYEALGIDYPYKDKKEMDKKKSDELFQYLMSKFDNRED